VIEETDAGQPRGCFLADPFQRVEYEDLIPLTVATCTISLAHGCVIVIDPTEIRDTDGKIIPWILPLRQKTALLKDKDGITAIVINLGGDGLWARR
jgi:hypothetical protein